MTKASTAWVGCTNVTDDRQTDEIATAKTRTSHSHVRVKTWFPSNDFGDCILLYSLWWNVPKLRNRTSSAVFFGIRHRPPTIGQGYITLNRGAVLNPIGPTYSLRICYSLPRTLPLFSFRHTTPQLGVVESSKLLMTRSSLFIFAMHFTREWCPERRATVSMFWPLCSNLTWAFNITFLHWQWWVLGILVLVCYNKNKLKAIRSRIQWTGLGLFIGLYLMKDIASPSCMYIEAYICINRQPFSI